MGKIPRFYIPPGNIQAKQAILTLSAARHAVKTLRLRKGDKIVLFDGTGTEYHARLSQGAKETYFAEIYETFPGLLEPTPRLSLYAAPIKKERWEWMLEKATELGVSTITPLLTQFVEIDATQNFSKKKERWEAIIQSACEQSGRNVLPKIHPPVQFKEAMINNLGQQLLFHQGNEAEPLKQVLSKMPKQTELLLLIGPEGGFSDNEVSLARSQRLPLVSLGKHTLRAETACLTALALVRFHLS